MFFETNDLIVDKLTIEDTKRFYEICNKTFVLKWMDDWRHDLSEIEILIKFFIQGYAIMCPDKHALVLAIRLKETKEFIGICGFGRKEELGGEVEICYFIDEKYANKGYMSQVVQKAIKFYFEITNSHYLCAIVDKGNVPSYQLLMANGFVFCPTEETDGILPHYKVFKKD